MILFSIYVTLVTTFVIVLVSGLTVIVSDAYRIRKEKSDR